MIRTKASLGGEQSGHILSTMNDLCGDGIFTALKLCSICNNNNISIPGCYPTSILLPLFPLLKNNMIIGK